MDNFSIGGFLTIQKIREQGKERNIYSLWAFGGLYLGNGIKDFEKVFDTVPLPIAL